jgi:hypothetical protein
MPISTGFPASFEKNPAQHRETTSNLHEKTRPKITSPLTLSEAVRRNCAALLALQRYNHLSNFQNKSKKKA